MKRYGMVIKLKPDRIEEYKRLHAATWAKVLVAITESNIKNYSIYLKDDLLFSYFEYTGTAYDTDMEAMAEKEVIQNWWDVCKPCMLPIESREEGEWWANMEEIFHHD
jgi:L-rhamnose mutarotase